MLKDKNGNELKTDFYVGPATFTCGNAYDIYYIEVDEKGGSFTIKNWEGFLPIINFQEAAENFVPLMQPRINCNFLRSELEKLSKK